MFKSYKELPEDYQRYASIDMKDNKKEFVLLNILAIIAIIPFFIGLGIMEATITMTPLGLLFFMVSVVVYIILHELVHGIFFKIKNKVKVRFKFHGFAASASVPGVYYQKKHYLMISLAPFIVLSIVLLPFLFILSGNWFYLVYFIFATHFSGCVGDFYVFVRTIFMPKDILIEDYGVGMKFYHKVEEEN